MSEVPAVYRVKQESSLEQMDKEQLLQRLENAKFRRVKSRMFKEALKNGSAERGNHTVKLAENTEIWFYYRGTPIAVIPVQTLIMQPVYTGEFDNTPSSINQRKQIRLAVEEIQKAIDRCQSTAKGTTKRY